eukprot:gene10906-22763_t
MVLFFYLLLVSITFHTCQSAESSFQPYIDHGGTVAGISGTDFCILCSDTRLSEKYFIHSRHVPRIDQVETGVLLAGPGCHSDHLELAKVLQHEARMYRWDNKKALSVDGFAHLLSNTLYSRRNFPYYSFCILAGLDPYGHGSLYKYDCLGSYECIRASCSGKGEHLIQPILDRLINENTIENNTDGDDSNNDKNNNNNDNAYDDIQLWTLPIDSDVFVSHSKHYLTISQEEAEMVLVQAFRAAAEREITIGDAISIWTLTKDGLLQKIVRLPEH